MHILRLVQPEMLISADVFESLLQRHLAPDFDVELVDFSRWIKPLSFCAGKTSAPAGAVQYFIKATGGFDFFSTGFGATLAAPWLLALRNQAQAPVRLLFIAHAPGAYVLEWALLGSLLRNGDRIIAPSDSARQVIEYLYPEILPFVRVVRHPIHPLSVDSTRVGERFVSLSRIHPCRLLHRQIDAMAILHERGYLQATMEIAGPLNDGNSEEVSPYTRALQARIRRHGLEGQVRMIGTIQGDQAKGEFLSGVSALINLSVTAEESFSKSSVEAIASGIPVIATRWDGLTEAVGDAGILVSVLPATTDTASDVSAIEIADGLEKILNNPPSTAVCLQQATRFAPENIRADYWGVAQQAVAEMTQTAWQHSSIPYESSRPWGTGLLSRIAPLMVFTRGEFYELYQQYLATELDEVASESPTEPNHGALLHSMLLASCAPPLEQLLAGHDPNGVLRMWGKSCTEKTLPGEFFPRMVAGLEYLATQHSKEICLLNCLGMVPAPIFQQGLEILLKEGQPTRGCIYLSVEQQLRDGSFENAYVKNTTAVKYGQWEKDSAALRQLARIGRKWHRPENVVSWLHKWLQLYPDSPDSGPVWFDLCHILLQETDPNLTLARTALDHATDLLGETPAVDMLRGQYLFLLTEKLATI